MSSLIIEREISGFIGELQLQGREMEAELLAFEMNEAKGYLPDLLEIRDHWNHRISNPGKSNFWNYESQHSNQPPGARP